MDNTGQENRKLKVRFAPSPTGYLHIGGARTALFNFLYTRKHGGKFLLRIEDTDIKREKEDSINRIVHDMQWLGMNWDEGPIQQTTRLEIYRKYAKVLEDKGLTYPCYCTAEELETKRLYMKDVLKITPRYDGTCRNLTPEQKAEKEAQGRKPCLRFRVDEDTAVTVQDLIRGDVFYDKGFCGDFVIMKSDGIPSYNFAVVVDDHDMGVTLVMRAEEHLVNTPRQMLLYQALGFPLPQFAHISMILAPDHSKLSKRHGTVAVGDFIAQGYLPSALINYIALLGWSPGDDREFFSMEEMIRDFSLERVSKNPAVYDIGKLNWMNSQYIQKSHVQSLYDKIIPFLMNNPIIKDSPLLQDKDKVMKMIEAVKNRVTLLSDFPKEMEIFFNDNITFTPEALEVLKWAETPAVIDAFLEVLEETGGLNKENFQQAVKTIGKKSKTKGKKLYMPLRVALTGQEHGVEMEYILTLLNPGQMKDRLHQSLSVGKNH